MHNQGLQVMAKSREVRNDVNAAVLARRRHSIDDFRKQSSMVNGCQELGHQFL